MPKTSVGVNVHDQAVDAVYELVISVDVRKSGAYNDAGKTRMRRQLYAVLDRAFAEAGVPARAVHREDRGDGILAAVGPTVPPARILGVWVTEVHEQLRRENPDLRMPLGLRVGLHVGPVTHDAQGISGHAVDLACRLTDSAAARLLLERDRADLVVVVSDSLYREVVRHGGRFVDPGDYAPADLRTKDGATPAWVRLPGGPGLHRCRTAGSRTAGSRTAAGRTRRTGGNRRSTPWRPRSCRRCGNHRTSRRSRSRRSCTVTCRYTATTPTRGRCTSAAPPEGHTVAEPRNAPAAPAVRRADEPRDRADRRAGEERPRREPSEGDSPERDRPGRARPASGPGDQDGRERPRADPDRADEERPAPGGAEPGAADGEHPAGDPPAQDQEDQERAERERAAGRFRERSRDRLLDEQEEEGGAAVGMGATSRAHRQARGSYQVGGDHTLFDRTVFHQAHIGDVHLRLDSRQAVGAVSGPVPESELRRVRRIYLEPEGYVDLQQALRRQRVLVLAAAPGAGRTCTALALLDELTQGRPPAADGPQDGVRAGGPAEPPARVSRVSPETAVPQLTATVQGNGGQRHGYLLELPSGHGNPGLPPGELELDALAAALAGVGSYAVLVVAAAPRPRPCCPGGTAGSARRLRPRSCCAPGWPHIWPARTRRAPKPPGPPSPPEPGPRRCPRPPGCGRGHRGAG